MRREDPTSLTAPARGVAERRRGGLRHGRYHGRLVARQLDERHIVIRASFDAAIEDAVIGAWELQSGRRAGRAGQETEQRTPGGAEDGRQQD